MELLFYWIEDEGIFQNIGFNFSPLFYFFMNKVYDNKWKLLCESKHAYNALHIDNDNGGAIIENVTAIVGKNGVGKTTLIRSIKRFHCYPRKNNKEGRCLYILKRNNTIEIETNCEEDEIEIINKTGLEINKFFHYCNSTPDQRVLNGDGIFGITSIYLTNAPFNSGADVMGRHIGLEEIGFSPEGLSAVKHSFFQFIYPDSSIRFPNDIFEIYSITLRDNKKSQDFQQICDLFYYYERMKVEMSSAEIIKENIIISVGNVEKYQFHSIEERAFSEGSCKRIVNIIQQFISANYIHDRKGEQYIIATLKEILLIEICLDSKNSIEDIFGKEYYTYDINDIYNLIIKKFICDVEKQSRRIKYFENAIKEIKELEAIICNSSGAFNTEKLQNTVLLKGGKRKQFIDYVYSLIEYNSKIKLNNVDLGSFVLRYISIENLFMSSGERALLNLLSWLNFMAKYDVTSFEKRSYLKEHVLIFVDEIDALCHPEWQRDIIGTFINAISEDYKSRHIQVIITTHSPLCLSNIPRDNIIFLERNSDDAYTKVLDNNKMQQTFCCNLYDILNNTFYLGNKTIGNFASCYIDKLISDIKELQGKGGVVSEVENEYLERINIIGDPFIKNKLIELFYDTLGNNYVKQLRIIKLQEKMKSIQTELELLKDVEN